MNSQVSATIAGQRERISIRRRTKEPSSATASAADEALQRILDSRQRRRLESAASHRLPAAPSRQSKNTGGPRRAGRKSLWLVLSSMIRFIPGFISGG